MNPTRVYGLAALIVALAVPLDAWALDAASVPWWVWPLTLFVVTFLLGIVAVLGGVGGGVLFVPIVGGFFPFHLDFVRGAGLMLALSGALSAGPGLLKTGLASLRVGMPLALVGSITSILGAMAGLALPASVVQTALGAVILGIAFLMWRAKRSERPEVERPDALGAALGMHGIFHDMAGREDVSWRVHRTPIGFVLFAGIGFMAGMFGLGAGWANVPVLNLVMGAPLKVSVSTSGFLLSVIDTSAAWVYVNRGALLPLLVVPSILGVMLGARIGGRLLHVTRASTVRKIVIALLLVAGARAFVKGLGIWN
ncbi:MAG TPA: sulfite exporter TauE/SafE family protein [Burkholderiales bacterium]|nr:sulfite exporter TauE/SafE family protein [Burkholderiales bacterium]